MKNHLKHRWMLVFGILTPAVCNGIDHLVPCYPLPLQVKESLDADVQARRFVDANREKLIWEKKAPVVRWISSFDNKVLTEVAIFRDGPADASGVQNYRIQLRRVRRSSPEKEYDFDKAVVRSTASKQELAHRMVSIWANLVRETRYSEDVSGPPAPAVSYHSVFVPDWGTLCGAACYFTDRGGVVDNAESAMRWLALWLEENEGGDKKKAEYSLGEWIGALDRIERQFALRQSKPGP